MQPALGWKAYALTNTWCLGHVYFLSSHWLFSPSPLKLYAVFSRQGKIRLWLESLCQLCHTYIIHPLFACGHNCAGRKCHQMWLIGLQPSQTFPASPKNTWWKLPFLRAGSTDWKQDLQCCYLYLLFAPLAQLEKKPIFRPTAEIANTSTWSQLLPFQN